MAQYGEQRRVKVARSFLRHIRVRSRDELKERILKGIAVMNRTATVMRWKKFDLSMVLS